MAGTYASGALVEGAWNSDLWQGNPWKYALAWPIAVVALSAVARRGRPTQLLVLAGLGGMAAAYGHRSFLGFCALTCVLLLWGRRREAGAASVRQALKLVALLAVVGVAVYETGTYLALHGVLGRETQARTELSVRTDTSLIEAGRPEGAAALALARAHPLGFGPGVDPATHELTAAKEALAQRGVDPHSPYVNEYMFGGHIELHSITADMWVCFGLAGLILAGYIVARLLIGLAALRMSSLGFLIFMTVAALWDMAFSPLSATLTKSVFTVSLLIWWPKEFEERSSDARYAAGLM
jgi:hypothetical protein